MDIGTHRTKEKGKMLHQVVISFELADERKRDGDPVVINYFFPMWSDEGSPLYDLIARLKGRAAVKELIHNLGELCGEPCSVEVIHVENKKNGRMKADINPGTIAPPDREVPPPISTLFEYSASSDGMDGAAYDLLPEFVKTLVGTCEEVMHPVEVADQSGSPAKAEEEKSETDEDEGGDPDIDAINIDAQLSADVFGQNQPE
jgi:hypothetical protein